MVYRSFFSFEGETSWGDILGRHFGDLPRWLGGCSKEGFLPTLNVPGVFSLQGPLPPCFDQVFYVRVYLFCIITVLFNNNYHYYYYTNQGVPSDHGQCSTPSCCRWNCRQALRFALVPGADMREGKNSGFRKVQPPCLTLW